MYLLIFCFSLVNILQLAIGTHSSVLTALDPDVDSNSGVYKVPRSHGCFIESVDPVEYYWPCSKQEGITYVHKSVYSLFCEYGHYNVGVEGVSKAYYSVTIHKAKDIFVSFVDTNHLEFTECSTLPKRFPLSYINLSPTIEILSEDHGAAEIMFTVPK